MFLDFEHNERTVMTVRRHPLVLIGGILPSAILFLIALTLRNAALAGTLGTPIGTLPLPSIPEMYIHGVFYFVLFFLWMQIFHFFTDFYLDVWVLTNKRLISVDQKGFFYREVDTFRIERIQNVETRVEGIIRTLFHFGNVRVETAGTRNEMCMRTVPSPKRIRNAIMDLVHNAHGPSDLHDPRQNVE